VGRGGEADVVWLPARPGWSWLLVSDGIYKAVRLDELARLMTAPTAAAGYTYWTVREASRTAILPATIDSLRVSVDTLRAQVQRLNEPFGPSVPQADSITAQQPTGAPR
jgi:hypothetical protein